MDTHRIAEIEWISPAKGKHPRVVARLNKTVRQRIGSRLLHSAESLGESSIHRLAAIQNVAPMADLHRLSGGFPPDENIDEFLREIYEART